jgi:hypothetical protein
MAWRFNREPSSVVGVALVLATLSSACGGEVESGTSPAPSQDVGSQDAEAVGEIQATFVGMVSVTWRIESLKPALETVQSGTVQADNTSGITFVVRTLAPGTDYVLVFSGTSTFQSASCSGAVAFAVSVGQPTKLSLVCNPPDASTAD